MTARFERAWAKASRAHLAASVGFLLALSASQSASAQRTQEQRGACTPDVYRLYDPQRPGDHQWPAAAEGEPQRTLPGSVRAVRAEPERMAMR